MRLLSTAAIAFAGAAAFALANGADPGRCIAIAVGTACAVEMIRRMYGA